METVNYLAIIVAAVASMAVGFVWYGVLFRKAWMQEMGMTGDMSGMKMSASMAYLIQFVASIVMACVLSYIMWLILASSPGYTPLKAGLCASLTLWLGFVVPVSLGVVLWENKSWKLWFINASHYLVGLLVMGAVLSFWM